MITKSLLAVIAAAYLANGGHMLLGPGDWYERVPGVTGTGPMNPHFIRDIGFMYLLSGLAYVLALRRIGQAALWIAIGTAWPALHGGFHVVEWLVYGPPAGAAFGVEFAGVVLPAVIGVALTARVRATGF